MKRTILVATLVLSIIFGHSSVHAQTTTKAQLIESLLAQIASLQAQLTALKAAQGTATTTCTFTRPLYLGVRGGDVTCLQTYLNKKGHLKDTPTGYFGPLTKAAVTAWQKEQKLIVPTPDYGIWGERSTNIYRSIEKPTVTTAPTTPVKTETKKTTKRKGGGGGSSATEASKATTPVAVKDTNPTPTPTPASPKTPTTPVVTVLPITLVDFGSTVSKNIYGMDGWSTPLKDRYTDYQALGPGGTTIVTSDTAQYNYQGVSGSARSFVPGEKIVVTWYNNAAQAITFTPKISFNDADRVSSGVSGSWNTMSMVTVPALGTATSEFTVSTGNAGSYSLVNINVNYKNNRIIIADKIVLYPPGETVPTPVVTPASVPAAVPGDTTPPTVTAQNLTQNLSAGTKNATLSVTTNENATCKYGTSANTVYSSLPTTFSTTGGTTHSVSVSGLTDGSTKKFYVRCSDGSNNVTTSDTIFTIAVANPVSSSCDTTNRGTTRSIGDAYGLWENRPQWYFGNRVNNAADINAEAARNYGFDGLPYHEIDPVEQATIFHFKNEEQALPLSAQIRFAFPPIGPSTTPMASFSWEAKFDPRGTNGGKAFQLASRNRIHIEFNPINVTSEGSTWLTAPGTRTYGSTFVGGNGYGEQLSSGPLTQRNVQPALNAPVRNTSYCYNRDHVTGTNPRAFLVKPGQWYRFTYTIDWSSSPHRLWLWAESEDTPLTLLLADDTDSSKGFPVEFDPTNTPIDQFYFEFNNSLTLNTTDFDIKVRNFFVLKDVLGKNVPTGGTSFNMLKETSEFTGAKKKIPRASLEVVRKELEMLREILNQMK